MKKRYSIIISTACTLILHSIVINAQNHIDDAREHYSLAEGAYSKRDFKLALVELQKSENAAGNNHLIQYLRVKSFFQMDQFERTREEAKVFFEITPEEYSNSYQYKEILEIDKKATIGIDTENAELQRLKLAIEQNPSSAQAHFDLGNYYFDLLKNTKDSSRVNFYVDHSLLSFNNALQLKPGNYNVMNRIAATNFTAGNIFGVILYELNIKDYMTYGKQLELRRNAYWIPAKQQFERCYIISKDEEILNIINFLEKELK